MAGPFDPSREIRNRPDPTRPVRFRTPPDPIQLDPRGFETLLIRSARRIVTREKLLKKTRLLFPPSTYTIHFFFEKSLSHAKRGAYIVHACDPGGLTVVSFLQPTSAIRLRSFYAPNGRDDYQIYLFRPSIDSTQSSLAHSDIQRGYTTSEYSLLGGGGRGCSYSALSEGSPAPTRFVILRSMPQHRRANPFTAANWLHSNSKHYFPHGYFF